MEDKDIPKWVIDKLIKSTEAATTMNQKLGFTLEPEANDLPALKQGQTKLTAHRILRIRKVAQHIAAKLELKLPLRQDFEKCKAKAKQQMDQPPLPRYILRKPRQEVVPLPEEPVKAEEYIEICCSGLPLDPNDNLAIAYTFFKKNTVDIKFTYRRRYPESK